MKRKIDFDILESLRGIASLYVCIAHCRGVLWIGGEHFLKLHPRSTWTFLDYISMGLTMLTRLSTEFVIVFFVLSGFSIAHSLRYSKAPGHFYRRRFIRLYPPYVTAILWAMSIAWVIRAVFPHFFDGTFQTPVFERMSSSNELFSWKSFAYSLIYLPKMGGFLNPLWSLTHEVIFYILAPFLMRKKSLYYLFSVTAFIAVNICFTFGYISHEIILAQFLYYNLFFAIGVALYSNFDLLYSKVKRFISTKLIWLVGSLFVIMVSFSLSPYYLNNSQWALAANALFASITCVILIIWFVTTNLRVEPLIKLGRFSYTLYITHFPTIYIYLSVYYLISRAAPPYITNGLFFIPCVAFCLVIAYLLYLLVERRTKFLLDKLRKVEERAPIAQRN